MSVRRRRISPSPRPAGPATGSSSRSRNGGGEAREVRLHLDVDGTAAGEAADRPAPGRPSMSPCQWRAATAATVSLDDADGIQADNRRYLVLSESSRPLVLVVTNAGDLGRDAFYAQQALMASGADGAAFDLAGVSGAQLSGWDAPTLGRHAAVLLLSTRGLDQRGRELLASYVQRGGGVLVAASPDVDAQVAAGATGAAIEMTALPPSAASPARPRARPTCAIRSSGPLRRRLQRSAS